MGNNRNLPLDPFKEFLSSLSQISRLNFQVWDGNGLVFASGDHQAEGSNLKKHQTFSVEVVGQGAYQYASCKGRYHIWGTPLKYGKGEEVIGALIAYGLSCNKEAHPGEILPQKTSHAREMKTFLTHLAGLMEETWATGNEADEMAEELAQNLENLSLYGRISSKIKTLKFSRAMLESLLEEIRESVRVDLAFVEMPNRQEYNTLVSARELSDKIPDQKSFVNDLIGSIPQKELCLKEDYFIVNNSSITPGYMGLHPDPYRFLAVKVQHNGNFDGWLGLVSFNLKEIFRQGELRLLSSIAGQVSVLMANMDLYHDLELFVTNVVKSLVYAVEAKDVYTRGHSERVNRYCMLMADRLDLDKKQKEVLNWASILHDIGKIGIPESILNKPGPLNDEEYKVIKGHPKKGYDILKPLEQLSSSLAGITHHHERYDGKGYPDGLKGEEIPFLARIIAVADTFDAMTSTRAYRSAKSPGEAMAIMQQVTGSQLDSDLVQVFKEVFETVLKPEFESSHAG